MLVNHVIKFFAGRGSKYLAKNIAKSYGIELGASSIMDFSDGEFQPSYDESVRGATVFIIQSTFPPSDNLMELLLMIDAARRASAYKIVAVMPYFGWARQDRKDKPRCSIGAKLVADILVTAGVDRVMTLDLHADQIQGFFSVPVDHVFASSLFLPFIEKNMELGNLAIAAPDMGGAKRASAYAKILDCPVIICHKSREKANVVGDMTVIGNVCGKNVIIMDDMIDTAGTITKAAAMMMDKKALSVRAMATHALFSGSAYQKVQDSPLEEVIITDTIPLNGNHIICKDKIKVLSVADLFADIIRKVFNSESISDTFVM
ncbi:MAG: ribose-phosphate pyrophosphokinase [Prevotellaceae bacterium]|jgi:ribose-phosphate pyrophosphokinase|nr:ribose-phosphate pyrophosphokinase [Prevotellaceae bacterium]